MILNNVHNEIVWFGCEQYRIEHRYYLRETHDDDTRDDTTGTNFFRSISCDGDRTRPVVNFYSMPSNELVVDQEKREELLAEAYYHYPFYIVQFEWCLRDDAGVILNVQGYEKRRECDDSLLYQERHIRNFDIEDAQNAGKNYSVGDIIYDLDGFEKVRCLSCCGGTKG